MHDGHVAAAHLEAARGLQAEQAAADHHRFHARSGALQQVARVVERAEREDVLLVESRDRRFEGRASRRQQQRVVRRDAAVVSRDGLGVRVDVDHADAEPQWMSLRRYHSSGFSVMSSAVRSPARTEDSRIRL